MWYLNLYMASLVAQRVKSLPETQETWVRSLGQEDPLEKGTATHFCILAWKIPWKRSLVDYSPWGHKELDRTERLSFHFHLYIMEYYLIIKKNEMPFVATWMDLEIIILSEEIQRNIKYYLIALICRIKKKIQMNLFIKQKQTYRLRGWTYSYWEWGKGGEEG